MAFSVNKHYESINFRPVKTKKLCLAFPTFDFFYGFLNFITFRKSNVENFNSPADENSSLASLSLRFRFVFASLSLCCRFVFASLALRLAFASLLFPSQSPSENEAMRTRSESEAKRREEKRRAETERRR